MEKKWQSRQRVKLTKLIEYSKYMNPKIAYNYERIISTNVQKANNFDTVFKVNP